MPEPGTEKPDAKCWMGMHDGSPCGREPHDDKGLCICHSKDPDKDDDAFQSKIDAMLGHKEYDFTGFVFPRRFDSFENKTFEGALSLDLATFNDGASFERATFRGPASFRHTRFASDAHFSEATFEGPTSFQRAHFERNTYFHGTTFEDEALFIGYEDKREDNRVFSREAVTDFRFARWHQPDRITFQHVFLGRARFLHCDVRQVDFTDAEWAPRGRHNAVWDEMEPRGPAKSYPLIGKLYRQLKHN